MLLLSSLILLFVGVNAAACITDIACVTVKEG